MTNPIRRVNAYIAHRRWQIEQLRQQGLGRVADLAEKDLARRFGSGKR